MFVSKVGLLLPNASACAARLWGYTDFQLADASRLSTKNATVGVGTTPSLGGGLS
jgi:hypothetical protein